MEKSSEQFIKPKKREKLLVVAEIALIMVGAIVFCWNILDFNSSKFLVGNEFILLIQTHFVWDLLPDCGSCILWNGMMNGGSPSFAELHNAPLHPLVVIPALLFGAVNGIKLTLLFSIFIAGVAQWKLSNSMGLKRLPRLWSAYLIMFSGQLSGRLESGNVGLILSGACAFWAFSELYDFVFRDDSRSLSVRLAVASSMCILSGQGYYQLAVLLVILPLSAIFALKQKGKTSLLTLGKSLLLTLLLCGIFLVPLMHFLPNLVKDGDLALKNPQPLGYGVLNLVIKDIFFFKAGVLDQQITPYAYYAYIGWVPLLLAIYGIFSAFHHEERKSEIFWLFIAACVLYVVSSKEFFNLIEKLMPAVIYIRTASLINGLAVVPIVALGAYGLNVLLMKSSDRIAWQTGTQRTVFSVPLVAIFATGLMLFSLIKVFSANRGFLATVDFVKPDDAITAALETEDTQWISPINSSYYPMMFANNAKISPVFRPWHWRNKSNPKPVTQMLHHPNEVDPEADYRIDEIDVYLNQEAAYAGIYVEDELVTVCTANTLGGGRISVDCPDTEVDSGTLIVQENQYDGWQAWMDDQPVVMDKEADFLTVHDMPSKAVHLDFEYKPWDVWVGLAVTVLGIIGCGFQLAYRKK